MADEDDLLCSYAGDAIAERLLDVRHECAQYAFHKSKKAWAGCLRIVAVSDEFGDQLGLRVRQELEGAQIERAVAKIQKPWVRVEFLRSNCQQRLRFSNG